MCAVTQSNSNMSHQMSKYHVHELYYVQGIKPTLSVREFPQIFGETFQCKMLHSLPESTKMILSFSYKVLQRYSNRILAHSYYTSTSAIWKTIINVRYHAAKTQENVPLPFWHEKRFDYCV